MTQSLARIAGVSVAALLVSFGPAWAGGGKSKTDAEIKSDTNIGVKGGADAGTTGGSLNTDTKVDSDTKVYQPAASPKMDGDKDQQKLQDKDKQDEQSPRSKP